MSNPDDLDDGLLYSYESENDSQEKNTELTTGSGADTVLVEKTLKRELNEEGDDDDTKNTNVLSKRQKKLKNSKFHEKKREQLEYEVERRRSIPKSPPDAIVEYLATLLRENNPNLSALELDELYLKKTDFLSTQKFDEDRSLENFPQFVTQFTKAPRVIVFSMSNIRVADVFRSLSGKRKCLKLFSKNKLKDDLESVEQALGKSSGKKFQDISCFIGTPTRIDKIFENTDLFFQGKDKLDVILDASYLDPKKNTLLSSENTMVLCRALKTLLEKKSSVKILLY